MSLSFAFLAAFLALSIAVSNGASPLRNFDTAAASSALALGNVPGVLAIAVAASALANAPVIAALAVLLFAGLSVMRRSVAARFIVGAMVAGGAASALLKLAVGRARPDLVYDVATLGSAFPSGHALVATVVYGFVAFLVAHRIRSRTGKALVAALGAVIAIAVGASRVVLGVHWATDVIGGWVAGAAVLSALASLYLEARHDSFRPAEPHYRLRMTALFLVIAAAGFSLIWFYVTGLGVPRSISAAMTHLAFIHHV